MSPRRAVPALAGLAVLARLPTYLAGSHLTFDDGVFGASAVAMRHGGAPFREVFSSQGPLFLPLVWMGDLLGLRTSVAPRTLALVAGVVATLAVFAIVARLADSRAAVAAALIVGASGSLLWTSGPLAADGPALAVALVAVALALRYREAPGPGLAVAIGVAIGAAFAVKSLFAVPPGLAVAWVFLEARRPRLLAAGVAASAVVVLAAAVPWGLSDVWDQAVVYHLDAAGSRSPGANLRKVFSTLSDRDLLVLVVVLAGGLAALGSRLGRRARDGDRGAGDAPAPGVPPRSVLAPVWLWLGATLLVLVVEHPLWRPHLVHLVAPLGVLAGVALHRHGRVVGVVALVALLPHLWSTRDVLWPDGYRASEARAVSGIEALPPGAFAVSDEPGFVWRAGRRTPDDLVDTSVLRIDSERITEDSLVAATDGDPRVCGLLVWSHRFARFDLESRLAGWRVADTFGGPRRLYVRTTCHP